MKVKIRSTRKGIFTYISVGISQIQDRTHVRMYVRPLIDCARSCASESQSFNLASQTGVPGYRDLCDYDKWRQVFVPPLEMDLVCCDSSRGRCFDQRGAFNCSLTGVRWVPTQTYSVNVFDGETKRAGRLERSLIAISAKNVPSGAKTTIQGSADQVGDDIAVDRDQPSNIGIAGSALMQRLCGPRENDLGHFFDIFPLRGPSWEVAGESARCRAVEFA